MGNLRKRRKKKQRPTVIPERLLYDRHETAQLLGGISIAQVIRLEQAGLLDPLRPLSAPTGKAFYRAVQVRRLAQADTEGGAA
jgi:hypothetical protein